MAHECPNCGQMCYCGCDIDDCLLNNEDDVVGCTHYLRPNCDDYEMTDADYDAELEAERE